MFDATIMSATTQNKQQKERHRETQTGIIDNICLISKQFTSDLMLSKIPQFTDDLIKLYMKNRPRKQIG